MGKGIKGLIFGGAIGAALGILYAPRSGKKTRAILADKTEALWGEDAQEKGTILGEVAKTTKTAVEAGQNILTEAQKTKFGEFTKEATERGQQIFNETSKFVTDFTEQNVRPVFSEKNEELRKKIDSARAKIAAQVAQNTIDVNTKTAVKPATRRAPSSKTAEEKSNKNSTTTKKSTKKTITNTKQNKAQTKKPTVKKTVKKATKK